MTDLDTTTSQDTPVAERAELAFSILRYSLRADNLIKPNCTEIVYHEGDGSVPKSGYTLHCQSKGKLRWWDKQIILSDAPQFRFVYLTMEQAIYLLTHRPKSFNQAYRWLNQVYADDNMRIYSLSEIVNEG